jgi:uncharacterized SAM-binding protein YcdF (DUF218 family)
MRDRSYQNAPQRLSATHNAVRSIMRVAWSICVLLVVMYIGGFPVYVAEYQRAAEPIFEEADAIVVLTGGPDRIAEGAKLLAEKRAKRLFISGVNEQTDEDDLVRTVPLLQKFLSCCVTIDRDALNTHENAMQTLAWVKQNQINSIILVTSHAHMPRALFEFHMSGDNDVMISPWRVGGPTRADDWWHDMNNIRMMVTEYTKLIGAITRYFALTIKSDLTNWASGT